jgi:uncharacterized SAM-binding protein YcdF (DUF218 family)
LPYAELAIGAYFVYMVDFAIETMNYFALPFLMLFVCGYLWAGFTTLYQEYQRQAAMAAGAEHGRDGILVFC